MLVRQGRCISAAVSSQVGACGSVTPRPASTRQAEAAPAHGRRARNGAAPTAAPRRAASSPRPRRQQRPSRRFKVTYKDGTGDYDTAAQDGNGDHDAGHRGRRRELHHHRHATTSCDSGPASVPVHGAPEPPARPATRSRSVPDAAAEPYFDPGSANVGRPVDQDDRRPRRAVRHLLGVESRAAATTRRGRRGRARSEGSATYCIDKDTGATLEGRGAPMIRATASTSSTSSSRTPTPTSSRRPRPPTSRRVDTPAGDHDDPATARGVSPTGP